MSTTTLHEFDRNVRALIRSRHGIAVSLTYAQVKALLKAVNQPHGNAFMQKLRKNGLLTPLPIPGVSGHGRYSIDDVVAMLVNLNGGKR